MSSPTTLDWASLLGSTLGGLFSGSSQHQLSEDQLAQQAKLAADQIAASKAQQQNALALQATQDDPFVQTRSRQKEALLGMLMGTYKPATYDPTTKKVTGGMTLDPAGMQSIMSYFGPNAMASGENAFQQTASNVSPQYVKPNMAGVGYTGDSAGIAGGVPAGSAGASAMSFGDAGKSGLSDAAINAGPTINTAGNDMTGLFGGTQSASPDLSSVGKFAGPLVGGMVGGPAGALGMKGLVSLLQRKKKPTGLFDQTGAPL
jgi:hypothetical protein